MSYKWSAAELERLSELLGDHPIRQVHINYNCWARQNGYHQRSFQAIRQAAQKTLGMSTRSHGLWLLTCDVATLLGRSQFCIRQWIKRGDILSYDVRWSGRYIYIHRRAFRHVAATRPALLGGVPRHQLFQLLEDEDLAEDIALRFPKRISRPVKVRNKFTGVVYPTIQQAARETYMQHSSIIKALRNDRPCCGIEWEVVA